MAIEFHNAPVQTGIEHLVDTLRDALGHNQQVLWLVSGGSNVAIEVAVASGLGGAAQGFVTAALIDERFGPAGHADSNYQKLVDAGFESYGIALTPVLLPGDDNPADVAGRYGTELEALMAGADSIIAQLGIGNDGHTAGVLPHSSGVDEAATVISYQGPDFMRITMTLPALTRANQAFVFCYGPDKGRPLEQLSRLNLPLAEQPAQILKQIKSVQLYNDQLGGETE